MEPKRTIAEKFIDTVQGLLDDDEDFVLVEEGAGEDEVDDDDE